MTVSTVPVYGGVVPDPNTQSAEDFSTNAVTWTTYQSVSLVPGINTSIAEFNIDVGLVNGYKDAAAASAVDALASANNAADSALTAQSLANFKGRWSDATGAATVGSSYSHNGSTWRVEVAIADITLSEPSEGNSDWQVINDVNMANVNLTKLNNPLCHVLAPNAPVVKLSDLLSSTRASGGSYRDRYGVLRTVNNDVLREESDGYLMEGATTNELLHSEDFSNAAWSKTGITVSVDGIDEDGSNGMHFMSQSATQIVGKTYTVQAECFAKERKYLWSGIATIPNSNVVFDLEAGTVTTSGVDAINPSIRAIEGGKFIVSYSYVCTSIGGNSAQFAIAIDASGTILYQGVSGFGIGIDKVQLEDLPFPSSYAKTTTSTFARASDLISTTVLNNITSLDDTIAIAFTYRSLGNTTGNQFILGVDTNPAFTFDIVQSTSGLFQVRMGSSVLHTLLDPIIPNLSYDFVIERTPTNIKGYVNKQLIFDIADTVTSELDLTGLINLGSAPDDSQNCYGVMSNFKTFIGGLNADEVKSIGAK